MTYFQSIVLGVVQGLTEFLPISSSGHLVLFSKIPGWAGQPLVFDTTLHLATALVLIVYFWKDLFILAKAWVVDFFSKKFVFAKYSKESKLLFYIVVGSIPAGVLGLLFESDFEEKFRSVQSVALFTLLGAIVMFYAQRYKQKKISVNEVDTKKSLFVGIFQSFALFPGFSRSGSTISGALLIGLDRVDAAKFSFLMSVPIVFMAGVYKLISTNWSTIDVSFSILSVGFISSFLAGLAVVHFLLNYLRTKNLDVFVYYRLLLVAFLVFVSLG